MTGLWTTPVRGRVGVGEGVVRHGKKRPGGLGTFWTTSLPPSGVCSPDVDVPGPWGALLCLLGVNFSTSHRYSDIVSTFQGSILFIRQGHGHTRLTGGG